MAPVKAGERTLPITKLTKSYFIRQKEIQQKQKTNPIYYDNDLVIARSDGSPYNRYSIYDRFVRRLRWYEMPHIRFHDLRHTAATNMHQLTGDFFTVGQILGHSLAGFGIPSNISNRLESVTAAYVDVRLERKQVVLEAYHNAVLL